MIIAGCSLHYTDKKGIDHYIGFVHLKTAKNNCLLSSTVSSAGLNVDITDQSGGINVGYKKQQKIYITEGLIDAESHQKKIKIKKVHSKAFSRCITQE